MNSTTGRRLQLRLCSLTSEVELDRTQREFNELADRLFEASENLTNAPLGTDEFCHWWNELCDILDEGRRL